MIVTDFFFLLRVLSLSFQGSLWSVFMLSFCTVLEVHAQPVKCQCGKLHPIYLKMVFHLFVVWARLTETIGGLYCIVCWLASSACENTNMVHTSRCQNFDFFKNTS